MNRNLKNIFNKKVKTGKDWLDKLPFALWGYRTTKKTSTGTTLISLTYRMEVVFPVELEIPSLRVVLENQVSEVIG